MKKQTLGVIPLTLLVIFTFVSGAWGQEKKAEAKAVQEEAAPKEKLPSAEEILGRFVKEIGGKEVYEKIKSQYAKGTVEMPAQQMKGEMEVFAARPNKMLMKMSLGDAGKITTGFDGKVAWMVNPFTGPMLLEGKQKEQLAQQANFDRMLHDPKDYKLMEVTGVSNFEGEDCYKLKLVDHYRTETTEYFSKKTGLQKGFSGTQDTPFGPITATTLVAEYKKFGDVLFPAKIVQKMSGLENVMTITEMEFNKVPTETFELPPEVKALVK